VTGTEAGLFAAAGCWIVIAVALASTVLQILLLVWVHKDAKARGMDTPLLWVVVTFFFSLIAVVVYLIVRPAGDKVPCGNCRNPRLAMLTRCPHCGAD
jgi:hypothetical protein